MYYTIDQNKLREVTKQFNKTVDPSVTAEIIKGEICPDWDEDENHQDWINTASVNEIVDWVAAFYK